MRNIKSVYYYFLAIKIYISKIIKFVYFSTNFYNKKLKTKIPDQFLFFPNSYLLSPFTSYKTFSFKIPTIDPESIWKLKNNEKDLKNLHSFFWLGLIDRKNNTLIIRKIIDKWISQNNKYKINTWESSIISNRIISWILNSEIILDNTNQLFKKDFTEFKKKFLTSLVIQINHLKKNYKFEEDIFKKIQILSSIYLSGLVFEEYSGNVDFSVKELEKVIKSYFDENGFPVSRNPYDLLNISKYFIMIKECTKGTKHQKLEILDDIIEKNLKCLKRITTPINTLPLFNGATGEDISDFYKFLSNLNYKIKKSNENVGGIFIIKSKRESIFFDYDNPPDKKFSKSYQSGPLSFEYFSDGYKIITNCGYGLNISKKAKLLSKLTSAQSTVCINDTSVVKFEKNKFLKNAFSDTLNVGFRTFKFETQENSDSIKVGCSHDAYFINYGLICSREISIDKNTQAISGTDKIFKREKLKLNSHFDIRFHLYPGISVVKTLGGNSVLAQIDKNKSLLFKVDNKNISIEKSIFLAGNKILNNYCIVISGKILDINNEINWKIEKNI